jgi:hypothetical protein
MAKRKQRQTTSPPRDKRGYRRSGETPGLIQGDKVLKSGTISLPAGSIPSPSGGKSSAFDFTQALLHGNPAALHAAQQAIGEDTILGRAHRAVGRHLDARNKVAGDPDKEPSLADQFVASTYTLGKAMGGTAHNAKQLEPALRAYREDMKAAHRFVLDDDFVRYASEISSTTSPEKLLARLQYATLPYQVTWIEYDLLVKVRTMRAIHQMDDSHFNYNTVGRRLGYLLHRLNDTDAVCQIICQTLDDKDITAAMSSYYFSLAEHEWGPRDGMSIAGTMPMTTSPHMLHAGRASLWGYTATGQPGMLDSVADLQRLGMPRFLQRHGEIGYSRLYRGISSLFHDKRELTMMDGMMDREITEFAGTLRWVVCVLGMLNEVPLDARHVKPDGQVRVGLTGRRPMLDYHRLTLRLPKTKPLQFIERKFRQATRRRAHEVRAHWRTYVHEVHCKSDEHQWEYDHDNGYRLCGACNAYGRLIHEHVRGDPSLGWVNKEYLIKKDKQS